MVNRQFNNHHERWKNVWKSRVWYLKKKEPQSNTYHVQLGKDTKKKLNANVVLLNEFDCVLHLDTDKSLAIYYEWDLNSFKRKLLEIVPSLDDFYSLASGNALPVQIES